MESPEDQAINTQNDHRCYISELPNEVLLAIFKCNSNMEDDLPLDVYDRIDRSTLQTFRKGVRQSRIHIEKAFPGIATTLSSSQVNARWRDLIINTSTIWANLMNILFLDCVGDQLREEIVQRAQNALFHVEGKIYVGNIYKKNTGPWVSSFLSENWARIRHFNLQVVLMSDRYSGDIIEYDDAGVYRDVLSCLSMPAHALEHFTIQFPKPCDPLEIGSVLFNNHAPRLQIFQTQRMILNAEQCSWLPQLHQLRMFGCYTPPFSSVDALYEALSQMTNLEFLSLGNAIASPYIGMERAPIRLPSLRRMQIREDERSMNPESRGLEGSTCWPLLTNIIPNPGCSIEVRLATSNAGDINIPVLCRWASDYFDLPPGRSYLDFGVGNKQVWFADINLSGSQPLAWQGIGRFLVFQLDYFGPNRKERAFYRLLEALSLSGLTIPHLNKATIMLNTEYAKSFFSDPPFASLISSVASVKKLYTVPTVLQVLTESDKKTVLFPCLKTLEVIYRPMPSQYDTRRVDHHSSANTVLAFVDLQRQGGAPISRFVYDNQHADPYDLDDLSPLDGQCPGLEVAWKTRDLTSEVYYVCGDGSPEILDLINRSKAVMAKRRDQCGHSSPTFLQRGW